MKRHELVNTFAVGFGACVLMGLIESTSVYAMRSGAGKAEGWADAIVMTLPSWILLAVTAPAILSLAGATRLTRGTGARASSCTARPA